MKAQENNSAKAGQLASGKHIFGEFSRYAVFAVHTRFESVQWFVQDAEQIDDVTGEPLTIRQAATLEAAVEGLGYDEGSRWFSF